MFEHEQIGRLIDALEERSGVVLTVEERNHLYESYRVFQRLPTEKDFAVVKRLRKESERQQEIEQKKAAEARAAKRAELVDSGFTALDGRA